MEVLLQEIAKTFNIGNEAVQNIIDNYPQLRQQIVAYNFTSVIQFFIAIIIALSFIAFAFSATSGVLQALEYARPSYREDAGKDIIGILKKVATISFIVLVVSSIAFVVVTFIQSSQAPDVVVIKSLLEHAK